MVLFLCFTSASPKHLDMKTTKIVLLFSGLLLMAFTTAHHQPVVEEQVATNREPCSNTNNTFQNGEKLTYKIFYNWNFVWLAAGEVTFKVFDEGAQYQLPDAQLLGAQRQ